MLVTFSALSVQGFRSFNAEQVFDLAGTPGLVYVTGHNDLEPDLGANGIGKSSLFEALYWVLYGKTSVNLRAGDVANWQGTNTCAVRLSFICDEAEQVLARTWSPNTLTLNGEAITQERLEEVLGLTEAGFLHSVFHAQFVPQFADLAPAMQLEVFSDVLRLNVWEAASEEAARAARNAKADLQKFEMTLAKHQGELQAERRRVDEVEELEAVWWRLYINDLMERRDAAREASMRSSAAAVSKKEEQEVGDALAEAQKEYHEAHAARSQCQANLGVLAKEALALEAKLASISKVAQCPTCLQEVNKKLVTDAYSGALRSSRDQAKSLEKDLLTYEAAVKTAQRELTLAQDAAASLRQRRGAAQALLREAEAKKISFHDAFEYRCPHDVEAVVARVTRLEIQIQADEAEIAATLEFVAHCEFWNKAFREIRLSLVQAALLQLELVTNTAASALGLSDWEINYAVEAETKGGKIAKGFSVFVHSPHNESRVPFGAWSGGERQRLRLAITLGFANLIQDYSGVRCNIEVFDEPTAWLSEEGVDELVSLFAARAKANKVVLYLADHRALDSGEVARIVYVRKTEQGTVIESE